MLRKWAFFCTFFVTSKHFSFSIRSSLRKRARQYVSRKSADVEGDVFPQGAAKVCARRSSCHRCRRPTRCASSCAPHSRSARSLRARASRTPSSSQTWCARARKHKPAAALACVRARRRCALVSLCLRAKMHRCCRTSARPRNRHQRRRVPRGSSLPRRLRDRDRAWFSSRVWPDWGITQIRSVRAERICRSV